MFFEKPHFESSYRVGNDIVTFNFRYIEPKHWRIDFIQSYAKGKGVASLALKKLCEMADAEGVTLSLLPVVDSGIPLAKLKAWYARNGFVDYDSGMIRRQNAN